MAEDRRARGTGEYAEPLRPPLCPTTVSPGLLQEPPSLPVSTPVLPPPAFLHTAKVCSRDVVLIHVTLLIEAAGVCHLSSPSQGPASRRPRGPPSGSLFPPSPASCCSSRRASPHAASRAARWLLPRRLSPSAAEARGVAALAASSPPVSGRCSENTCGMRDCHQQRFYVYS